jgi:hypothetical protein
VIIAIDMDGTICSEEKTFERQFATLKQNAKETVSFLRNSGNEIIIYTARSHQEYKQTKNWLKENGIEYDRLIMGKFPYDILVDDRVIRFTGWNDLANRINCISKPTSIPTDYFFLMENRRHVRDFLKFLSELNLDGPIVEIGPARKSGILEKWPEYFVDTRKLFSKHEYTSVDIDPNSNPDILSNVLELQTKIKPESVGTMIMISVLEHVSRFWEVPKIAMSILKKGGRLCIQTPWNLRFHGPSPDCWRISDEGYRHLFSDFDIELMQMKDNPERPNMPSSIVTIVRKGL